VNPAELALIGAGDTPAGEQERVSFKQLLTESSPRARISVLLLALAASFSTVADHIFSGWIPLFLREGHQLDYKEMGIYSSLPLIGGAIGGVIGGFLNDAAVRKISRKWARRIMGAFGKGMAAVILGVALFFTHEPYLFCILLGVVKIFADISLATRWGALTDIGGRFTATMFSFVNAFAVVIGIVGSIAYGYLVPEKPETAVVQSADSTNSSAQPQAVVQELSQEQKDAIIEENINQWMPVLLIGFGCYILCSSCWLLVDCEQSVSS
jgi:MFS family permease